MKCLLKKRLKGDDVLCDCPEPCLQDISSVLASVVKSSDWEILDCLLNSRGDEVLDSFQKDPQILQDMVKWKAPPELLQKCIGESTCTPDLFAAIVLTYNNSKDRIPEEDIAAIVNLFQTCVRCLKPSDLRIDRIEVDFWEGHSLQADDFELCLRWSPLVIPLVHMLMAAGCSRPSQIHLLRRGYCFADPECVNLSLEACNLWKNYIFEPQSLGECSRKVIRQCMRSTERTESEKLGLPGPLWSFVCLSRGLPQAV